MSKKTDAPDPEANHDSLDAAGNKHSSTPGVHTYPTPVEDVALTPEAGSEAEPAVALASAEKTTAAK